MAMNTEFDDLIQLSPELRIQQTCTGRIRPAKDTIDPLLDERNEPIRRRKATVKHIRCRLQSCHSRANRALRARLLTAIDNSKSPIPCKKRTQQIQFIGALTVRELL